MSVTALLRTLPGGHRGGSSQQLELWRNNGLARFLCRLRGAFPEGRETEREGEANCRPPAAREPEPKPALPDAAAREEAGLRAAVREGAGPEAVPGGAGPEVPGRREREVGTWPPQRSRRMAAALSAERLEVSVDGLTLSPNAEAPPCEARPGHGDSAAGRNRAGPGCPSQAEAGGEEAAALSPERRWGFALEELYGLALRFFKGNSPGALEGRGGPRGARPENGAKNEKSASILACEGINRGNVGNDESRTLLRLSSGLRLVPAWLWERSPGAAAWAELCVCAGLPRQVRAAGSGRCAAALRSFGRRSAVRGGDAFVAAFRCAAASEPAAASR